VYIIDLNGEIIQHLNRSKGLQNNTVLSIYQDGYVNLWLGLDNGIAALKISSASSYLPDQAVSNVFEWNFQISLIEIVLGIVLSASIE